MATETETKRETLRNGRTLTRVTRDGVFCGNVEQVDLGAGQRRWWQATQRFAPADLGRDVFATKREAVAWVAEQGPWRG
jgi:hypothetical protein